MDNAVFSIAILTFVLLRDNVSLARLGCGMTCFSTLSRRYWCRKIGLLRLEFLSKKYGSLLTHTQKDYQNQWRCIWSFVIFRFKVIIMFLPFWLVPSNYADYVTLYRDFKLVIRIELCMVFHQNCQKKPRSRYICTRTLGQSTWLYRDSLPAIWYRSMNLVQCLYNTLVYLTLLTPAEDILAKLSISLYHFSFTQSTSSRNVASSEVK